MKHTQTDGFALILVLWILALLMVIALEFSFAMRQEATATRNYKDEIDCYFYALSGFQQALGELIREAHIQPEPEAAGLKDDRFAGGSSRKSESVEGGEEQDWRADQRVVTVKVGQGAAEVMIGNENGKWNLNAIPEDLLRNLIGTLVEDVVERDTITDSILDWIDDNQDHRANGAEDDYYESLAQPYSCKDAPFDTVEELLQVRGVTPQLLYGCSESSPSDDGTMESQLQKGLVDLISVQGSTNLDINTAQKETLISAGMTEEEAEAIIDARQEGPITNMSEVVSHSGQLVHASAGRNAGGTFSIVATGSIPDSTVLRRIKAVVKVAPFGTRQYQVLYWADNYPVAENLVAIGKNLWE